MNALVFSFPAEVDQLYVLITKTWFVCGNNGKIYSSFFLWHIKITNVREIWFQCSDDSKAGIPCKKHPYNQFIFTIYKFKITKLSLASLAESAIRRTPPLFFPNLFKISPSFDNTPPGSLNPRLLTRKHAILNTSYVVNQKRKTLAVGRVFLSCTSITLIYGPADQQHRRIHALWSTLIPGLRLYQSCKDIEIQKTQILRTSLAISFSTALSFASSCSCSLLFFLLPPLCTLVWGLLLWCWRSRIEARTRDKLSWMHYSISVFSETIS